MLYEFTYKFYLTDILLLLIFILPISTFEFSLNMKNVKIRVVGATCSILFGVVIFIILIVIPVYSYFHIKSCINEGNFNTVEGVVENFDTPESSWGGHKSESFTINAIDFYYSGNEHYGYSKFLCDGGVITGNGQQLRITYCTDKYSKRNVICSITQI